ncbi:MAG: hypothetical protein L0H94_06425 [Nitrospira sp.]|nr:hypothetical protein [Nitrospira sp.]
MKQIMERTEPTGSGIGIMKQTGRRNAIQPLPASEQFSTRSCVRCEGLLVSEWSYDLQNPDNHNVETLRCVQCGNLIDPIILQNQVRMSVERHSKRQVRYTDSMRTVLLGNVA